MRSVIFPAVLSLIFLVFFSTIGLTGSIMLRVASSFRVHNVDTGKDFISIMDAVNANDTLDGHTIMVDSGTYSEFVIVNKSLLIFGENRETTILTGATREVFNVTADNAVISGFTFVGSDRNHGSLLSISNASNVLVYGNDFVNNTGGQGVLLYGSGAANITMNGFYYNYIGVAGYLSSKCSIDGNLFENDDEGMYFSGFSNSLVRRNNIMDVAFSVFFLDASNYNVLAENNMTRNTKTAVRIGDSMQNTIVRNNISECGYFGIRMKFNSDHNYIVENNIFRNDPAGLRIEASTGNHFYHNNFYENTEHASTYQSLASSWDDGYISGGNYWDGYAGEDVFSGEYQNVSNPDGIMDTHYTVDSINVDEYPLMGPFSSYNISAELSINLVSNSAIYEVEYLASNNTLILRVSNRTAGQTAGFSRICIPHDLISGTYNVTIDGAQPEYLDTTLFDNSSHRWIYVIYSQSPAEIAIAPEFSSTAVIILLGAVFSIAYANRMRRRSVLELRRKQSGRIKQESSSQN